MITPYLVARDLSGGHGVPCPYGSVTILTPGQAGAQPSCQGAAPFDPALRDLRLNRPRFARAIHKQRPYPSEKCSSRIISTSTNPTPARDVESLLGCGRGSQIAEGPEIERFQDAVFVFIH